MTPLITALRDELYDEPYASIEWNALRGHVSSLDMYTPHPLFLRVLNRLLKSYEDVHASGLRQRSLDVVLEHVHNEDDCTLDIDIGPVNKAMNMLVVWHADGPDSARFARHAARIPDYLWLAGDGMKMQGYNGSQLWDTAFSVQAVFACRELADEFGDCLQRAHHYLDVCQVVDETKERERWFRHQSKGAWPFSTRDHGWPISDCTAEGLKTALLLADWRGLAGQPLAKERLFDAVDVVLSLQNTDGGWATYELQRGSDLLEVLNPSEVFHGIMVDYPYVECTSACLQALARFRRAYPYYRSDDVDRAGRAGAVLIMRSQRLDGSWYGSWGVFFTYATWFGVLGLLAAGVAPSAVPVARAVAFLESKQLPDGGWGETFASCETMQYVHSDVSQVVNTAWAMLALIAARYPDAHRLQRAARLLIDRQQDNGNWLQEGISGVFNANCAISYSAYKNYFPIWALGAYHAYTSSSSRL